MLTVDLGRLERQGSVLIDAELPPDAALVEGTGVELADPVRVEARAQYSGLDVVVRGRATGRVRLGCRRCLATVEAEVEAPLTLVYREDVEPAEAEAAEAYPLPARAHELDLGPAVREHLLLALPQYALCSEACRGLCPVCGTNLNEADCSCVVADEDERWAPLKRLLSD
ncbi:MAG: DUF177 domain-containing protein [Gemmatimonadota bacterium]